GAGEGGVWCCRGCPPIRAGQTCRYRAHSSRCSSESCPSPVRWRPPMPPAPAPAAATRCCRRRASSTASASLVRRPRPRARCRRTLAGARPSIIRRGFTGRPRDCWRSTRSRPTLGSRRPGCPRSQVGHPGVGAGPTLRARRARLAHDAAGVSAPAGGTGPLVRRRRPAVSALAIAIPAAALWASPRAFAQSSDEQALRSTLEPRLAYVITGDAEVDRISKAGLQGLTLFLAQRTALEAGAPIGLDPARHPPGFYPLVLCPTRPHAAQPR